MLALSIRVLVAMKLVSPRSLCQRHLPSWKTISWKMFLEQKRLWNFLTFSILGMYENDKNLIFLIFFLGNQDGLD